MKKYICKLCQAELEFRYIDGKTVPIHPSNSQCQGEYDVVSERQEKTIETPCPKCAQSVYFLRHNGGSVWLDDLGWPWPKHPCMEQSNPAPWPPDFGSSRGSLVQIWIYGVIRGKTGLAVHIPDQPLQKRPCRYEDALQYYTLRKLLCATVDIEAAEKLDGKLILRNDDGGYSSMNGIYFQDGGEYIPSNRFGA